MVELVVRHLGLADYLPTLEAMRRFTAERDESTPDEIWLLQHPRVFTQGQAGKAEHLLAPGDIPVIQVERGGQVTYHGPGQLVGYPITDLNRCGRDLHRYVTTLENTLIETCARFGVQARIREGLVGVWVENRKIASIGVGVKKWIAMHGFALNITRKSLPPFLAITPCGIQGVQMTCLEDEMFSPLPEGNLLKCFGDVFAALWEEKFHRD